MTQNLFYVEVTKSAWVLAENEEDAKTFADEILNTEYLKDVDVFPYTEEYLRASGWDRNTLVYHKGPSNKDLRVGDVMK